VYGGQITAQVFVSTVGGQVTLTAPNLGDIPRYNVNGDSAWDPVNAGPYPWFAFYPTTGTAITSQGLTTNGIVTLGNGFNLWPTTTAGWAYGLQSAASTASTSTIVGLRCCESGSVSTYGIMDFYRVSVSMSFTNVTGCRYWLGLGNYNSTGAGNNSVLILGSTAYASDSPNKTTIGFFESPGTFPHWQAVSDVAGGAQTTVDTGVAVDTNRHLWEIASNANGTVLTYFIDHVIVATISTNIPNPASQGDALGEMFWTGDNKNATNSCSGTTYWFLWSMR
jgi:hypothetical protein